MDMAVEAATVPLAAGLKPEKRPRKQKRKSNTQLSLELMRGRGYTCAIVEKWNPHARIRQDLFGIIDVLCVKGEEIVGVQCCSRSDVAPHIAKITESDMYPLICKAISVIVHGWERNRAGQMTLREVHL